MARRFSSALAIACGCSRRAQKPEGGDAPGRETGWANLDRVKVSIRPDAEWRQMYAEAWRLQREQFWVADMGGVNWRAIRDRYAPLVERVGSRAELSDLFWEMQGELGSSHAYELGGDYRARPNYQQGHLGVDWRFDPKTGRYTIERILHGDPWEADATSPLLSPGANLQVGDAITAINGQRVTPERGPRQLLVNQAGAEVLLTVQPADGGSERQVTVRALGDEMAARYRDWVTANRRAVHEATNGRAGYIHIPDMGSVGYSEFHRAFLAEYDRDALIVDVRHNGGGIVSGLLLEKLMRPRIGYSFQRWGPPEPFFIQSPSGRAGRADGRVRRVGRRHLLARLEDAQAWPADRQAHLGRRGRHRAVYRAGRRHVHDAAGVRLLVQRCGLGRRELRRGPDRGGGLPAAGLRRRARPATRAWHRRGAAADRRASASQTRAWPASVARGSRSR